MLFFFWLLDYHTPVRQGASFQRIGGRNAKLPATYIPQIQSGPHQTSPLAMSMAAQAVQSGRTSTLGNNSPHTGDPTHVAIGDYDKYYMGNQPQPPTHHKYTGHSQNVQGSSISTSHHHDYSLLHHQQAQQHSSHHVVSPHHQHHLLQQTNHTHQQNQHPQQMSVSQQGQGSPSHLTQQGQGSPNHMSQQNQGSPGHLVHNFQNLRVTSTPVSRTDVTSAVSRSYGVVYSQPVSGITSGVSRPMITPSNHAHQHLPTHSGLTGTAVSQGNQGQDDLNNGNSVTVIREGML